MGWFGRGNNASGKPSIAAATVHGSARGPITAPAYSASSGLSQELAAYWPGSTSGDSAVLPNLRVSLDRARDLVRNDPHASAGVSRIADMLVGSGWLCVPTPDARALGITPDQAREIARQIRSEWKLFARDPRKFCDARRRLSMDGIFRLAARTLATANETTAVLKYDRKRVTEQGARYATSVAMVDPDRLCNPQDRVDTVQVRGGVEFDASGAPCAYHLRNAHVGDFWNAVQSLTWERIPRETDWGRPVFIHGFEPEREDQTRGITPFASLVSRLRMIGKHADTELAAATANALIAAFIQSDLPSDDVAQRMTESPTSAQRTWVDKSLEYLREFPARLGGVRIPVLPAGTKLSMNGTPRQTTAFPAFQTAFLQSIASALGISYEQLAMDWSRTNYSSARAALNEVWRSVKRLQAVFRDQFVTLIYTAFLEEAFDRGYVAAPAGAPSFWDMPEAWTAARWIGPGRGWIDPVKEAEASALRMEGLVSNLEIECADQGLDFEENVEQIAFENDLLAEKKLSRLSIVAAVQANKGADPDSEEATGPAGPGGDEKGASASTIYNRHTVAAISELSS